MYPDAHVEEVLVIVGKLIKGCSGCATEAGGCMHIFPTNMNPGSHLPQRFIPGIKLPVPGAHE
jgi:hypothetical protein